MKGKAYETVVRPGAMHGLEKIFTDQKKVKMTVAEILETIQSKPTFLLQI